MTDEDYDKIIDELESELSEYKHVASALDTQWAESQDEIADLKDKLAKAVTRLQHIAANKTTDELTVIEWDTYDMFTLLDACISEARTTLAELTSSEAAYGEAKGDNDE